MSAAKVRLEQELQRLESLLRLLDDFEHNPSDEQLLAILSKKLKVIVPELRALSLDPAYKTSEYVASPVPSASLVLLFSFLFFCFFFFVS